MQQIVLMIHILVSVALVALVLLQRGKGASMGAAFGSGASQTVFGSKGSVGFLVKFTVFLAAIFFATSITLTYMAAKQAKESHTADTLSQITEISKMQKAVETAAQKTEESAKTLVKKAVPQETK